MAFENDRNVRIVLRVDDADATAKLLKIDRLINDLGKGKGLSNVADGAKNASSQLDTAGKKTNDFATALDTATARSQGLGSSLVSIDAAANLLVKTIGSLGQVLSATFSGLLEAQKLEGITRSFQNLQGSIGQITTKPLEGLREVTRGLASDAELLRLANQAVLLGVDDGSGKFKQLAADAVKLGQAMGRTAAESIQDLTLGIGRQSRLILDNLGIVVKAEQAYKNFAAQNNKTVESLTQTEQRLAFQKAAFEAITVSANRLREIQETAGVSTQRLASTFENQRNKFLTTLSASDGFREALENLNKALQDIDVTTLAQNVGVLLSKLVDFASGIVPVIENIVAFGNAILGLKDRIVAFGSAAANVLSSLPFAQNLKTASDAASLLSLAIDKAGLSADNSQQNILNLRDAVRDTINVINESKVLSGKDTLSVPVAQEVFAQIERFNLAVKNGASVTDEQKKKVADALSVIKKYEEGLRGASNGQNGLSGSTGKTNDELATQKARLKDLADELSRVATNVPNKYVEGIKDVLAENLKLGKSQEEINKALETYGLTVAKTKAELKDFNEAQIEVNKELAESGKERFEDVQDQLKGLEDRLKSGKITYGDYADGLKAIGDASDVAAEDTQRLRAEIEKFEAKADELVAKQNSDFLSSLSSAVSEGIESAITSALEGGDFLSALTGSATSIGKGLGEAFSEAIATSLGASLGPFAGVLSGVLSGVFSAAINKISTDISELGKSAKDNIEGLASAAGLLFGSPDLILGGNIVAGLFGKNEEPTKQARANFVNFIDTLRKEADFKSLLFGDTEDAFDVSGDFFDPILVGLDTVSTRAEETINKLHLDPELEQEFLRLGDAFSIAFDLGQEGLDGFAGQLGQILAVNLQDELGLNELQLLFEAAGLSAEQVAEKLEEAFFRGDISAQKFLETQQATVDLFNEGIPGAVGATDAAFTNLTTGGLESGQRGLDSLRDLYFEAAEAGLDLSNSLEPLKQKLIEQGAPIEDVNRLFQELAEQGIKTGEDLKNIDLTTTANIVVGLQEVGFGFKQVKLDIDSARSSLEQFRAEAERKIVSEFEVRVSVTGDEVPSGVPDPRNLEGQSANR